MSNRADLQQAKEQIKGFLAESRRLASPISARAIHRHFVIDYREFRRNLWGTGPTKQDQRDEWIRFAAAIQKDRRAVMEQLLGRTLPHLAGSKGQAETLMETALKIADSVEAEDSVNLARQAFLASWREGLEVGLRMLPRMLYVVHRYGTLSQLTATIKRFVLPALDEPQKPLTGLPKASRAAIRAMLACILNEGGDGTGAYEFFRREEVSALQIRSDYLWLPVMLIRNESHYWAWHGGLAAKAKDFAEHAAERDQGDGKQISLANTRCETLMATGHHAEAWEKIKEQHRQVRIYLDEHFDLKKRAFKTAPMRRFHHAYASFVFALLAKCQCGNIHPDELAHELNIIEAITLTTPDGRPTRPIRIGHRPRSAATHPHPELNERLQRVIKETRRETLTLSQVTVLKDFDRGIASLGDAT